MPQSNTSTVGAYYTAAAILESMIILEQKLDGKSEIDFYGLALLCNSKELGPITKAALNY